jgi:general secretion pathway protein G
MAIAINKNNRAGFTLMELLIVIMILGALMAALAPAINTALKKAKKGTAKAVLSNLKQGVIRFQGDVGKYPQKLKDLVERPKSGDERVTKKWDGPYYGEEGAELPEDPWGEEFHYKINQQGAKHPFELYSYGSEGKGSPKEQWIDVWD